MQVDMKLLDKSKDLFKYFAQNFMGHKENYDVSLKFQGYVFKPSLFKGSRGDNYTIEILKEEPGMLHYSFGNITHGLRQLMSFRYFTGTNEVNFIGHGTEAETYEAMESLVLRYVCIIGPIMEMIEVRTKDATDELQILNLCSNGWIAHVEYSKGNWNLYAAHNSVDDPLGRDLRIKMFNVAHHHGPFAPARITGDINRIIDLVPAWMKEEKNPDFKIDPKNPKGE